MTFIISSNATSIQCACKNEFSLSSNASHTLIECTTRAYFIAKHSLNGTFTLIHSFSLYPNWTVAMATIPPFVCSVSKSLAFLVLALYGECNTEYTLCVYIYRYANLRFYPSHQPVNILLMQLANTYFSCFFGEKNVVVFLYSCWLVTWTQLAFVIPEKKKWGDFFFVCYTKPISKKRMLRQIFFSLQCRVPMYHHCDHGEIATLFSRLSFSQPLCRRFDADALHIYIVQTRNMWSALPAFTWEYFNADPFHFMAFYGDVCSVRL